MQIVSVDQNDNAADDDIAATATATATEDNDEDKPQTTNNNKDNNNNNTETHKMIINDKNKNDNLAVESIANESAEATKAKARLKWLDGQTRFLCRMLDDLYRTGIRRQIDRPRTERCHRVSYLVCAVFFFDECVMCMCLCLTWMHLMSFVSC